MPLLSSGKNEDAGQHPTMQRNAADDKELFTAQNINCVEGEKFRSRKKAGCELAKIHYSQFWKKMYSKNSPKKPLMYSSPPLPAVLLSTVSITCS